MAQQLVAAMLHEFGSIPSCIGHIGMRGMEFWGVGTDFPWQHE
jgi:hypothetical protein